MANIESPTYYQNWLPFEILSGAIEDVRSGNLCRNPSENREACDAWRRITGAALLAIGCLIIAYNAVCIISFSISVAVSVVIGIALYVIGLNIAQNTMRHLYNTAAIGAQAAVLAAKLAAEQQRNQAQTSSVK